MCAENFAVLHMPLSGITGLREQLSEEGVGQAYWLLTGLPPFFSLRDLRARHRGDLPLD